MNKVFLFIKKAGIKMISKSKVIWSKIGLKSTSKVAAWASKNKGWLQAVGISAVSAGAGAVVTRIIAAYIDSKESTAQRWMDQTGTSNPVAASNAKAIKIIQKLRRAVDSINANRDDDESRQDYIMAILSAIECVNYLAHNDNDDEVRRITSRATVVISGCCEAGVIPEDGFSSPAMIRTLRNLSEDNLSAEDIEGFADSVLDIAESGEPLKSI